MAQPHGSFNASVSLLHNNLACSAEGWLASLHNSVNVGQGRVVLFHLLSGMARDGPEVTQATSIRYLTVSHGSILCVSSTNGTQIYNEDATMQLYFAPVGPTASSLDRLKFHQGACVVPEQDIVIMGTSAGGLAVAHAAAPERYVALAECLPSNEVSEVCDVCFCEAIGSVISAHANGELLSWLASDPGVYTCFSMVPDSMEAPMRIAAMGTRILVAYGPGIIRLYDAPTWDLQVELVAHARWITAVTVLEETSQVATVGEDTVLNVWGIDPATGEVSVQHSSVVADKLLTGVALHSAGVAVTAYDVADFWYIVAA